MAVAKRKTKAAKTRTSKVSQKAKAPAKRPAAKKPAVKNNPSRAEVRAAVEKVYKRKVTEAEVTKALQAAIAIHNIPKERDIKITHHRKANPSYTRVYNRAELTATLKEAAKETRRGGREYLVLGDTYYTFQMLTSGKWKTILKKTVKDNPPSKGKAAAKGAKAAIRIFDTNKDGDVDKKDVKRWKGSAGKPPKKNPPRKLFTFYVTQVGKSKHYGKYLGYISAYGANITAARVKLRKERPDLFTARYRLVSEKPNPGILSTLADIAVIAGGVISATEIRDKITTKPAAKRNAKPAKKIVSPKKKPQATKNNPGAVRMFEDFHGRPSGGSRAVYAPLGTPAHTGELGVLHKLILSNGRVIEFRKEKTGRTYYAVGANTAERPDGKIFIVGAPAGLPADETIPYDEVRPLGAISSIFYQTKKDWDNDVTPTPYKHTFKAPCPIAGVDRFGDLHLVAGGYKIRPEGIVD